MWVIVWLCLVIIFVIIEAMTLDLTAIWFAFGALIAMIVSLVSNGFIPPFIAFIVGTLIFMISIRPIARKYIFKERVRTNIDRIIGMNGYAMTNVDAFGGEVKVDGKIWSARSTEEILKDTKVEILEVQGVKIIVRQN